MARSGLLLFGVVAVLVRGGPAWGNDGTLTFAGGLSIPRCMGQEAPCEGSLDPGPSLEVMALAQPTRSLGWGIMAGAQRVHWSATYLGQIQGAPPSTVEATLTTAFLGVGLRFKAQSNPTVNPIALAAAGLAVQAPSSSVPWNDGAVVAPAARIGVGESIRASPRVSWFVLVAGSLAWPVGGRGSSDGPPSPPLAAWGLGVELGIALDVAYTQ
jgi:hypothetical protein